MLMYAPGVISVLRAQVSQWHAYQERTVTKQEFKCRVKIVQLGCIVLLAVSLNQLAYAVKVTTVLHPLLVVLKQSVLQEATV